MLLLLMVYIDLLIFLSPSLPSSLSPSLFLLPFFPLPPPSPLSPLFLFFPPLFLSLPHDPIFLSFPSSLSLPLSSPPSSPSRNLTRVSSNMPALVFRTTVSGVRLASGDTPSSWPSRLSWWGSTPTLSSRRRLPEQEREPKQEQRKKEMKVS